MNNPLNGIVHPKMKIVIIYSPSCRSKPVCTSFFCLTQNKIFWRMLVTKQFWFPLTFIVFIFYFFHNGSQQEPKHQHWSPAFFKISYFVFHRRRKCIQVWNNMRANKGWQNLNFSVNYPFLRDCSLKNANSLITYSPSCHPRCIWLSLFCGTQTEVFRKIIHLCKSI